MSKSWATLEERVRDIASYIWDRPCKPGREAGVNVDAIIQLQPDHYIFIEITERRDLNKQREDVVKLAGAKLTANASNIYAKCFSVVDGKVTPGMVDVGKAHHIEVLSVSDFQKMFFDFSTYRHARELSPFGSAINPFTGKRDESSYVQVAYVIEGGRREVGIKDIAAWLQEGRHVVLLGEYGSGKSRCIKEVFSRLAHVAEKDAAYPVAIDLRESWGLKRAGELVRRHFTDLGLESLQSNAIKAALRQSVVYLLDGFDEIGSQAWSSDDQQLRAIRAKSLEGVRDLVTKTDAGVLIAGRAHYFPSHDEMVQALGVNPAKLVTISAKSEFSEEQIQEYFHQRNLDVSIPSWLPRRPLICQTVSDMSEEDVGRIFGATGDEAGFWDHFLDVVCARDARIRPSTFTAESILQVLIYLARITRSKSADVGPITLDDVHRAFEFAVGQMPVDQASAMLQRLPGLGRIGSESVERQFVDTAILDSLRAKDTAAICKYDPQSLATVGADTWANPLGDLGQRVASQQKGLGPADMLRVARQAMKFQNRTLVGDLVGTLLRGQGTIDFGSLEVDNCTFGVFDMSERKVLNLTVTDSIMYTFRLPREEPQGVQLMGCEAGRVHGVAGQQALPRWAGLKADHYDSTANVAQIRKVGLSPAHEILVTIIGKTFFQAGAGRKEEALLRGLGNVAPANLATRVLNLLMRENLLTRFKGNEGWVYAPNREHAARMKKLREELGFSDDALWKEVGDL